MYLMRTRDELISGLCPDPGVSAKIAGVSTALHSSMTADIGGEACPLHCR